MSAWSHCPLVEGATSGCPLSLPSVPVFPFSHYSIVGRSLCRTIDDHDFYWALPRFQLEAQLLLNGGENRGSLLVLWYWTIIRRPNELHFKFSIQTGLVHDQSPHVARQ